MKKFLTCVASVLLLAACTGNYDDSAIKTRLDAIETKLNTLEANIQSLQSAVGQGFSSPKSKSMQILKPARP